MRKLPPVISLICLLLISGCSRTGESIDPHKIADAGSLTVMTMTYHNVVEHHKDPGSGWSSIGKRERLYWLEYDGTVDISYALMPENVSINGNSITVTIPDPIIESHIPRLEELPEPITSPDNLFFQKNEFTAEDGRKAYELARTQMEESASQDALLAETAQQRFKSLLTAYIDSIGEAQGTPYTITFQ